jgi:tetratricopeptide (TPR) repeat protein
MPINAIIVYVADKILGRIISQEPWTKRVSQKIFPPVGYRTRLRKCINETIDEYEKKFKTDYSSNKFPFYHSQILFDMLSQYILFDNGSVELIKEDFEKNSRIIKPRKEELKKIYQLFLEKVNADEVLKTKFIDENYKEKIFSNASKLDEVLGKLEAIKGDTEKIKANTQIIIDKLDFPEHQRDFSKELTARLPLLVTDKIVTRNEDLTDIRNRLLKNKQVVLVNGMGGIGKTTLAQLYLSEYYDTYKHLIWISISSDDFISDFTQTPGFKESLNITLENKTPQEYFVALISAVKSLPHKADEQSLMVIDNAEANLLNYCDYLPHPPHWHIITTSRLKLDAFDVKELDFLNEEQSVRLFKLYYKRERISDKEIKDIVKVLEYHTLTIEILAKTAQNDGLDVQKTVNTIAENYPVEVDTRHASGKIDKITSYLSSIFDLSKLSQEEIGLLKQFCYLPPQFHAYQTLETILLPTIEENPISLQRILSKLVAKGWLLYNEATSEYKLHRIISDVVKYSDKIIFTDISLLINSISSLLEIDQTKDNPVDKFQWVTFGNYLLAQLLTTEDRSVSILQNNLALVLKDLGDYTGAKGLLEKAMVSAEKNFGKDHPTTAVCYSNLALVLKALGDYTGAKGLLEKAMVSDEKNFGKDHPTTAVRYSNLATVLQDLGDYTGAKGLLEKAMVSDEENFGKDHPPTARSYSNLALVLQDLGDYTGAKGLLEKAMEIFEGRLGNQHPNTIVVKQNLEFLNGVMLNNEPPSSC